MLKTITYGFIVLTLLLLSGCFFTDFPSGQPEEFTKRKNVTGSLLGSTSKEVQDLFGPPRWIAHKHNTTYFIYQWRSTAITMVWLLYLPMAIGPDADKELHCILMEFGEDDIMKSYEIDSEGMKFASDEYYSSCAEVFGMQESASMVPTPEVMRQVDHLSWTEFKLNEETIAYYCKKADRDDANVQAYVGDLYYIGEYGVEKNLIQAFVWFHLAAKNGNSYAAMPLERVMIELSPQQLNNAQTQLEEWEPGRCKRDLLEAISDGNE